MKDADDEVAAIVRKFEYAQMELDPAALFNAFRMMGVLEAKTEARIAELDAKVRATWRTAYRVAWISLAVDVGFAVVNGLFAAQNSAHHKYGNAVISLASATLSTACCAWIVRLIDALNRSAKCSVSRAE